jgi:HD-GYP domain-containing protein (c-di-GMP phosphodiesterase class II)
MQIQVHPSTADSASSAHLDTATPGLERPTELNRPFASGASRRSPAGFPFRLTVVRYVAMVVIAGLLLVAAPPSWTIGVEHWLPAFLALTILSTCLEFVSVELPHEGVLSVATISHIATMLLVPPPFSAISVAIAVLAEQIWHRKSLTKLSFNTANFLVTVSLGSWAIGVLGNPWLATEAHDTIRFFAMVAAASLIYYIANDILTSGIIAIVTERSLVQVFRANARNTLIAEAGAAAIGALFALIWVIEPVWTVLLGVPGAVISSALRYIRQLETETRSAVKSLAGAIDDRDTSTYHHSERVAGYALLIAREMRLPSDTIDLIEQAAEVHDLGKIGIPDRVLLKEGPLTEAERTQMWLHTEIGAKILSRFQQFRPGAAIVLHHHENYDGTGYPHGLIGEAIPIGARVVAVADAFDAMTSNRPYRAALPHEEAIRRIRAGAGRQWDPVVVGVFLKLVSEGRVEVEGTDVPLHVPASAVADPIAAPHNHAA